MAYYLLQGIPIRQTDASGVPISGAKLHTWTAGTQVNRATYTDSTGGTPHPNPIVADTGGHFPEIWVDSAAYDFEARVSADVVVLWQALNVRAPNASSLLFTPSGFGAVSRSIEAVLRQNLCVLNYVAAGESPSVDIGPALQRALNVAGGICAGLFTAPGVGVYIPTVDANGNGINYFCGQDITIPDTTDGVGIYGDFGKGAMIIMKTGKKVIVGDSATDTNITYGFGIQNVMFIAEDTTAAANVCLELHVCSRLTIQNVIFSGFWIGIDAYRLNRSFIENCVFWNASRTTNAAAAGIRLKGVASGTGGGIHLAHNEYIGNGADPTMMATGVLVHTVDGLYLDFNHYSQIVESLRIEPLGTATNTTITDIKANHEYYDNPSANSKCVRITGTLTSGGAMQDIEFTSCLARGAGLATNCYLVDVADGGTFTSGGGTMRDIKWLGGTMKSAKANAIEIKGTSASKLELYGGEAIGVHFDANNTAGAAAASCVVVEAESFTFRDNYTDPDTMAAPLLVKATMSLLASNKPAFSSGGNDYSKTNCSGADVYDISVVAGALVQMDPDIEPGPGQVIGRQLKTATASRTPVIMWSRVIHSDGQVTSFDAKVMGCNTSGTQGATRVVYRLYADIYRSSAGNAAVANSTVVSSTTNVAGNNAPVKLTLLDGVAWIAGAAVTAGDMCKSGGNVYLVEVTGTLDGAVPPSHTSGVALNGTALLGFVSATAVNTLALIVSGPDVTTMKWLCPQFNFGAVP